MAEKEYIEREEVREAFRMEFDNAYADDITDRLPVANVQEVRHGKWIPTNHPEHKRCSACDVISFIASYPCIYRANYCPNCGAKMDEE